MLINMVMILAVTKHVLEIHRWASMKLNSHFRVTASPNYLGHNLIGQTENAIQRAAFASIKRSFSVNGLSITFTTLASWNVRIKRLPETKYNVWNNLTIFQTTYSFALSASFYLSILYHSSKEEQKPTFIGCWIEGLALAVSPTMIILLTLPLSSLSVGEIVECRHCPLTIYL